MNEDVFFVCLKRIFQPLMLVQRTVGCLVMSFFLRRSILLLCVLLFSSTALPQAGMLWGDLNWQVCFIIARKGVQKCQLTIRMNVKGITLTSTFQAFFFCWFHQLASTKKLRDLFGFYIYIYKANLSFFDIVPSCPILGVHFFFLGHDSLHQLIFRGSKGSLGNLAEFCSPTINGGWTSSSVEDLP